MESGKGFSIHWWMLKTVGKRLLETRYSHSTQVLPHRLKINSKGKTVPSQWRLSLQPYEQTQHHQYTLNACWCEIYTIEHITSSMNILAENVQLKFQAWTSFPVYRKCSREKNTLIDAMSKQKSPEYGIMCKTVTWFLLKNQCQ